ncbi:MAG: hypothetical protein HYY24_01205 [Verrucomicrobia bacterium]|nr:hypothetical protein [Verrucomicrobiota bacterium]
MKLVRVCFAALLAFGLNTSDAAQRHADGFLRKDRRALFPIGSYELPKDDAALRALAEAGVNLVRCHNRADLDRARAAGLLGWMPVSLAQGAAQDSGLRALVESVADHPALAVWEGPDEIVWNFTAYSGLFRSGVYKSPDEWWQQTPLAVERSEAEAARILPRYRDGVRLVRRLDRQRRPLWLNEAAGSDLKFVREFLVGLDITGCDIYPIHDTNRRPWIVADYTERYKQVGQGRPVWMVLQGFSWHELDPPKDATLVYPSFVESRLMAWAALAHGAKGILYWGTEFVPKESPFRQSLLALTSQLAALQPFLVAKDEVGVKVNLIETEGRPKEGSRGVSVVVRRTGREWLIALVNEDNHAHMGVEVTGLKRLEGRTLAVLYDTETATVKKQGFITRLRPLEVKAFATSRNWESVRRVGRDFR